jgi:O-methyltransferase
MAKKTIKDIIINNLFIQNFASSIFALIHPYIEFTLSKYSAIRKVFYITAQDDTLGDYLEFGVFTGSSFNFAIKINRVIDKVFGKKTNCQFFGFDSFQGFGEIKDIDQHPNFVSKFFFVNKEKVIKNTKKVAKKDNFKIVEGFYQDTIKDKRPEDLGLNKARVVMIDCDLKESTTLALEFIKPCLQNGTIILFDDFHSYKGDINKGEYGAFADFKNKYPEILFRKILDYGYQGVGFIVYKI